MYCFCTAIWFHVPTRVADDDAAMDITFYEPADVSYKPSDIFNLSYLVEADINNSYIVQSVFGKPCTFEIM